MRCPKVEVFIEITEPTMVFPPGDPGVLECAAGLSESLLHRSLFYGQLETLSQSLLGKCVIFAISK